MIDLPIQFQEGVRVLMLIDRGVQNSKKGSKRWINKIISTNPLEFQKARDKLLELQEYIGDPMVRLYTPVNSRSMKKAITTFKHKQLEVLSDNEYGFYRRINDEFCSCLMKPENKDERLFLLDIDTKRKDILTNITNFPPSVCYLNYPTPNGMHMVVDAFNPQMLENYPEVTVIKDGLILLNVLEDKDD